MLNKQSAIPPTPRRGEGGLDEDIYLPIEIATEEITEEIIYSMVPGLTVSPTSQTWINAQNDSAIEGKADYYGNGAAGGPDGMGSSNDELTQFQAGLFRNRDTRLVYDGTINTQRSNPLYSTDTMGESEEVLPESVVTTSSNIANPAPAVLSADRHNAEQRARIGSVLQNFDVKGDSKKILHEDASNYSVEVKPIEGDYVIKVTYLTKSHEFKYSELVPLKDELLDAINDGLFNAFAQVADEEDVKILPEIATYIEDKIHDISQNALVKESLMETTLIEKLNLSKFMQYGLLDMVAFAEYLEEYKEAPEYLPPTDDIFLDDAYVSMSPEELLDVEDSIALALNEMTRDKRFSHLLMGTPTGVVNALTQYFAQNEAHIPYENTRAVPKLSAPLWEDNASLERDISNIGKQYDIIATHFEDGTHKITFTADSTKEDGNITPREFMNFERDLSQLAGVKDVRIDTYDYKITVYLGESQKGINMNKTKLVAAKLAEAEEVQTKENNMLSNPQVAQVVRVIYEQRSQFGEDYEFLSPNEVARMAQEQGFELSYNEIASIAYEIKDLVEALELDTLGAVDFDMQAALAGTPEVVAVDNTAAPAEELPEELESATVLKGKGVEVKEALVIEASAVQNNATEFLSSNGAILSGFRGKRKYKDKEVYDFNGSYQVILTSSNLELFESGKLIYQTSNKEVIKAFREIMLKLNKVNNKQDIDANKAVIMELLLDMQYSGSTLDANHSMSEADNKNKTVEGWAKELGKPYSEIHKYWLKAEKEADKKLPKKDYWKEVNYIAQRMIGAKYGEFKPTKESLGEAVKLKESVAPEYANEDGDACFKADLIYMVEDVDNEHDMLDRGEYKSFYDIYAKSPEELGDKIYLLLQRALKNCATFKSASKEQWVNLFLDPYNNENIQVLPEDYKLLGFIKVQENEEIFFEGTLEAFDVEDDEFKFLDGSFGLYNYVFTEELTPTALLGQPATIGEADIALDEDGLVEVGTYYLPTWAIAPLMNGDISELTNEEDSALAAFEAKFSSPVYDFHEDTRDFCKTNDVDGSEGECIKCTVYENSMEEAYDDLPKNKHMGMGLETDDHFYEGGEHEGFAKTASHIAHQEHIPEKNAAAILANAGRKASAKAHRENPRLNKIKGEAMESKQKGGDMNKIQEGGGAGYEITFKGLLSYDIESNRGWKGISDIIEVPYQDEVSIEGYDWSTTWAGKCGVLRLMKKSLIFSIIQLDDKLKEAIDIYLTDFNIEPFIYGAGSSFSLIQPNEPIDVMVQIYANIDGSIVYPYVSAKFYPSEELSYAVEDAYNHEEDEYYDDEEEPYDESLNKKSNKSIVKESIMNNKQFKQLKESLISNNRKPVSKLSVSLFKEELKESQKPEPLKESLIMPISGFEYSVFKKGNLGEGSGKMITQGIAMVEGQNVKVNGKSFSIKSHDFVGTKGY